VLSSQATAVVACGVEMWIREVGPLYKAIRTRDVTSISRGIKDEKRMGVLNVSPFSPMNFKATLSMPSRRGL
jgi:hypothetical protein